MIVLSVYQSVQLMEDLLIHTAQLNPQATQVGFEPTWDCSLTGFQDPAVITTSVLCHKWSHIRELNSQLLTGNEIFYH